MSEVFDLDALLRGSRAEQARCISLHDNDGVGASALSAAIAPHRGRACVVGITGPLGAGKSSLVGALTGEWVLRGRSVAVLAIDPSSPISGGALLGDRIRMGAHADSDRVFIRSASSRGHVGALSGSANRIVDAMDAAGFDTVIVETVGAGQSEVAIRRLADVCVVVLPPGLGDEIQAIKAGIVEIADILVVNKGDRLDSAQTVRDLRLASRLRRRQSWEVPVLRTVATTGEGIDALVDGIDDFVRTSGIGRRLADRTGLNGPGAGTPGV